MQNNKTKALDIIRLILAIFMLVVGIISVLGMVAGTVGMFESAGEEDTISGLAFLIIIPIVIYGVIFLCLGIKGIKKYNRNKEVSLVDRNVNTSETIVKIVISIVLLTYASVPLVIYYICDLIEANKKLKVLENNNAVSASIETPEKQPGQQTSNLSANYCSNCGQKLDKDAKFCKHCGKEVK